MYIMKAGNEFTLKTVTLSLLQRLSLFFTFKLPTVKSRPKICLKTLLENFLLLAFLYFYRKIPKCRNPLQLMFFYGKSCESFFPFYLFMSISICILVQCKICMLCIDLYCELCTHTAK